MAAKAAQGDKGVGEYIHQQPMYGGTTAVVEGVAGGVSTALGKGVTKAGAGGSWRTIGERPGGAVGQATEVSCGAACGQMVSGIPQAELIIKAGAPTDVETLARALGKGWKGGYVGPENLPKLFGTGRPFVAELKELSNKLGHLVVVDGVKDGQVLIRDPAAGGSTYRMVMEEFKRVWNGNAVFN
jgi:hypothetical protein